MKSSSAHKRSRIQPELNHRIESKLLITSVSRQALGIPSAVLNRYDHLRHEQELQKEYNLKFLTDRKRNSSGKKQHSASKRSGKDTRREKMGETITLQPQRLFYQSDQFRQKYNNLHQTHLKDKEKWISDAQKLLTIKQAISNFFISPDQYTARDLAIMLDNEKVSRSISKLLEGTKRYNQKEEMIREIMRILQVGKSQDILDNLRARVERFRNLDQCTFKILELESVNKRVVSDFQERMKKMRREVEESTKMQMQRIRDELQMSRRSKLFLQEQINLQKQQYEYLLNDLTKLTQIQQQSYSKWKSGRPQVLDLHKCIMSSGYKLRDIEVEAEQNMFKLLKANEDIVKLEQLMSLIKDDMNKQLAEQQEVHQQNLCEISQLNNQMNALDEEIVQLKEKCQNREYQLQRKQKEFKDEMNLMAASLGLTESHSAKVNLKIQELVRELAQIRLTRQSQQQALKEKDQVIIDLSRKIERLNIFHKQLQENTKKVNYEKEQYKFLLNNLREQVGEMKKSHNEEKNRIVKEKDEEIVRSNRDILESYSQLKEQSQKEKLELNRIRFSLSEKDVELSFLKNKLEQATSALKEKQTELMRMSEENQRYKKYLKQIEASFKEVVQLQEKSSRKVSSLQSENLENRKLIKIYQNKNQELDKINNELIQTRNELKMCYEKVSSDLAEMQSERLKLESSNVQLRLQAINKQSQITKMAQELKNMNKQCKNYKLANQKLLGQLNSVTRKLVMYRVQTKKKYGEKYKTLREIMAALKIEYHAMLENVKNDCQTVIDWTVSFIEEMLSKVESIKEGHLEEKTYLEELRELQQERFKQQLKLMEEKQEEEKLRGEEREEQLIAKLKQKQNILKKIEEERQAEKMQESPKKKELKTSFVFTSEAKDKKDVTQIGIQCNLLSMPKKSMLFVKCQQTFSQLSLLMSQNKQLKHSLQQMKRAINQELQQFLQWFASECEKGEEFPPFARGIKRKDTPIFPTIEQSNSLDQRNVKFQEREDQEPKESINSLDEAHLMEDVESDKYDQGDNVNSILQILVEGETDIPTVPYWKKIEGNFLAIRRKLNKKNFHLKLDLSAIDSKELSQPSPSSINYGESEFFSKRVSSEPDDVLEQKELKERQTFRSEKVPENTQMLELLKRENEQLKMKILSQTEEKADFEQKIYELKMVIQDMEIKLVSLENQTSIKGLEHNFKKMLDYIVSENGDLFEQSCRIIMKMLHFTNAEIHDYQQKFNAKKKKKKTGLFGGLFKN